MVVWDGAPSAGQKWGVVGGRDPARGRRSLCAQGPGPNPVAAESSEF